MLKVFGYLKSSILSVLAVILLLFVQAGLDLTLPDYTSKIVNIGVQQAGIENAAIKEIGEESYEKLLLFMSDSDSSYIRSYYKKDKKYKKEVIYKLKRVSKKEAEKISDIFAKPMTMISFIEQSKDKSNESKMDFEIPEGMDIYTALSYMDNKQRSDFLEKIDILILLLIKLL